MSQTLKIQIKDQFHRHLHPRNARNHNATSAINKLTLIIQKLIHDKTYKKNHGILMLKNYKIKKLSTIRKQKMRLTTRLKKTSRILIEEKHKSTKLNYLRQLVTVAL